MGKSIYFTSVAQGDLFLQITLLLLLFEKVNKEESKTGIKVK